MTISQARALLRFASEEKNGLPIDDYFQLNGVSRPEVEISRTNGRARPHQECLELHNKKISRKHALLTYDQDKDIWTISDLKPGNEGTKNGVWVNGTKVLRQEISHGDYLVFGPQDSFLAYFFEVEGREPTFRVSESSEATKAAELGDAVAEAEDSDCARPGTVSFKDSSAGDSTVTASEAHAVSDPGRNSPEQVRTNGVDAPPVNCGIEDRGASDCMSNDNVATIGFEPLESAAAGAFEARDPNCPAFATEHLQTDSTAGLEANNTMNGMDIDGDNSAAHTHETESQVKENGPAGLVAEVAEGLAASEPIRAVDTEGGSAHADQDADHLEANSCSGSERWVADDKFQSTVKGGQGSPSASTSVVRPEGTEQHAVDRHSVDTEDGMVGVRSVCKADDDGVLALRQLHDAGVKVKMEPEEEEEAQPQQASTHPSPDDQPSEHQKVKMEPDEEEAKPQQAATHTGPDDYPSKNHPAPEIWASGVRGVIHKAETADDQTCVGPSSEPCQSLEAEAPPAQDLLSRGRRPRTPSSHGAGAEESEYHEDCQSSESDTQNLVGKRKRVDFDIPDSETRSTKSPVIAKQIPEDTPLAVSRPTCASSVASEGGETENIAGQRPICGSEVIQGNENPMVDGGDHQVPDTEMTVYEETEMDVAGSAQLLMASSAELSRKWSSPGRRSSSSDHLQHGESDTKADHAVSRGEINLDGQGRDEASGHDSRVAQGAHLPDESPEKESASAVSGDQVALESARVPTCHAGGEQLGVIQSGVIGVEPGPEQPAEQVLAKEPDAESGAMSLHDGRQSGVQESDPTCAASQAEPMHSEPAVPATASLPTAAAQQVPGTTEEVHAWAASVLTDPEDFSRLSQEARAEFLENVLTEDINGKAMQAITDSELRELGLTLMGPRKRFLARVQLVFSTIASPYSGATSAAFVKSEDMTDAVHMTPPPDMPNRSRAAPHLAAFQHVGGNDARASIDPETGGEDEHSQKSLLGSCKEMLKLSERQLKEITTNSQAKHKIESAIMQVMRLIHQTVGQEKAPLLSNMYHRMNQLFRDLQQKRSTCVMVGDTGAGKSTLLNAVLGESNILPTNGMRACTATIIEVRYRAPNNGACYSGEVEFMTENEWADYISMCLDNLTHHETGRVNLTAPSSDDPTYAAFCILVAVFGEHFTNSKVQVSHGDRTISVGPLAADLKSKLEQRSRIPPLCLHLGEREKVASSDAVEFRKLLEKYSDSQNDPAPPQLWPLVKKVTIFGPWNVLRNGTVLVDAPGVRDENAARDRIVKEYMKNADRIWICANIKRAVNNKTAKTMLSETFRLQLLMDGKYERVVFVATQADDFIREEVVTNLGLDPDTSLQECANARKTYTRTRILADFSEGLREMQADAQDEQAQLSEKLRPQVFCVSALEFQKLAGLRDGDGEPRVFSEGPSTEIQLLRDLVVQEGCKSQFQRLKEVADLFLAQVESLRVLVAQPSGLTDHDRDLVTSLVTSHAKAQNQELQKMCDTFCSAWPTMVQADIKDRIKMGAIQAVQECQEIARPWRNLHNGTYFATLRRGGKYRDDWNEKLAQPMLQAFAVQWERVFFQVLPERIEELMQAALSKTKTDTHELIRQISLQTPISEAVLKEVQNAGDADLTTSTVNMTEQFKQIAASRQRDISRAIGPEIRKYLIPHYTNAAKMKGKGCHRRRADLVEGAIQTEGHIMYSRAETHIIDRLDEQAKEINQILRQAVNYLVSTFVKQFHSLRGPIKEGAKREIYLKIVSGLPDPVHNVKTAYSALLKTYEVLEEDEFDSLEVPNDVHRVVDGDDAMMVPLSPKPTGGKEVITVVVIGDSGAGKSTFINALLGEVEVLPTNSMRASTAAIVEIMHLSAAMSDAPEPQSSYPYQAVIEFISKDEWSKYIDLFLASTANSKPRKQDKDSSAEEASNRIHAAYGRDLPRNKEAILGLSPKIMQRVGTTVTLTAIDGAGVRKNCEEYIDSTNSGTDSLWPIVKRVRLYGPWECLKEGGGVRIVDAPGLADDNSARESMVKAYLAEAHAVWLVSNIRRAVNDAMLKSMVPIQFRQSLVRHGSRGSLVYIATHTDSIVASETKQNLNLPEDTTIRECAIARNTYVKRRLMKDFWEGVQQRMQRDDGGDQNRFEPLAYTISAVDFQRVEGLRSDENEVFFSTREETEIPQLRQLLSESGTVLQASYKAGSDLIEKKARAAHSQIMEARSHQEASTPSKRAAAANSTENRRTNCASCGHSILANDSETVLCDQCGACTEVSSGRLIHTFGGQSENNQANNELVDQVRQEQRGLSPAHQPQQAKSSVHHIAMCPVGNETIKVEFGHDVYKCPLCSSEFRAAEIKYVQCCKCYHQWIQVEGLPPKCLACMGCAPRSLRPDGSRS